MNVGWRKQIAEETGAQEKETGKEVGVEGEGALRMQSKERDSTRNQWRWVALASRRSEQSQMGESQAKESGGNSVYLGKEMGSVGSAGTLNVRGCF